MDIYQTVTDRIVAALEQAQEYERPWLSAFAGDGCSLRRPLNAITGKPYHGINVPMLWSSRRASPHWATYKAWSECGAQVRKGEKGTPVVFWKKLDPTGSGDPDSDGEDSGNRRSIWLARAYWVFNAEQVEDAGKAASVAKIAPPAPLPLAPQFHQLAHVEDFFTAAKIDIRHGGSRACYVPSQDFVQLPPRQAFIATSTRSAAESYYGVLSHEAVHWTGDKKRCDRDLTGRFAGKAYAMEELVAELGSAFLCADLGISAEPRADHAAYIKDWLAALKNDKRAVFTAATKAEQAVKYLASLQPQSQPAAAVAA